MKKLLIFILVATITFINISFYNSSDAYSYNTMIIPTKADIAYIQKNFIEPLDNISNQLDILGNSSLQAIIEKRDKSITLKDVEFIKSQIRGVREQLRIYENTESGNIDKNPLVLYLFNVSNYYLASLSYMQQALSSNNTSDTSKYLQLYYISKTLGNEVLAVTKKQLSE